MAAEFYNPMEIKVNLKRINTKHGNTYYIGNSNMEFETKDTVIMFYPPAEGERIGTLVVKKYEPPEDDNDDDDDDVAYHREVKD